MNRLFSWSFLHVGLLVVCPPAVAAEFSVEKAADRVTVRMDGKIFTEYLARSGQQPILWPIVGPTGAPMTRGYPMESAAEHEREDHVHHRSLWFTHGDVNGVDFWAERGSQGPEGVPLIKHREFVDAVAEGDRAKIVTRNDWLAPSDDRVCEDERTLVFTSDENSRTVDFQVVVKATDGDVTFGDTKEGSFAVRVAGTMKVEEKLGGKIVNSRGQTDRDAWARPAEWVDYHGPVDGDQVGIAILSHPSNFRHPCRWHVRTYGLFAANPFSKRHFAEVPGPEQGAVTVGKGNSLTLRYRVIFHRGDEKEAGIAAAYKEFAGAE